RSPAALARGSSRRAARPAAREPLARAESPPCLTPTGSINRLLRRTRVGLCCKIERPLRDLWSFFDDSRSSPARRGGVARVLTTRRRGGDNHPYLAEGPARERPSAVDGRAGTSARPEWAPQDVGGRGRRESGRLRGGAGPL